MHGSDVRPRIVSLLASATEIVVALGLEEHLVGISHECDYPARVLDRPRVSRPRFDPAGMDSGRIDRAVRDALAEHGSVYEVDAALLESLAPDLVLTQAVCEVCAVPTPGVREVIAARAMAAEVLSLDAHTLEGILATVSAVGARAGAADAAAHLVGSLRARAERVRRAVAGRRPQRVLAIEWLDPPFAPGHWVPEMVEAAGGSNLIGEAGARSRQIAWEDMHGLDPDVLVIMPCGYDVEAARADADRHADALAAVAPRAIAQERAFVVDGSSYFNRSGPRAWDGIEVLAALLQPDAVPPPSPAAADLWQPTLERSRS